MDEGYIKYNCEWIRGAPPPVDVVDALNLGRNLLRERGLLGITEDGIGFGNISVRGAGREFIISGSATGGIERATPGHYTYVTDYDIDRNFVRCRGPIRASSEAMTHAAIYAATPGCGAVAHGHSPELWEKLINRAQATPELAEFGTPELAREVMRIALTAEFAESGVIVLAGHPEGIITIGPTPYEAARRMAES
ncbi:MAG: class II aldolase/adducin family protein [Candidatus Kapaibacterium sp.]